MAHPKYPALCVGDRFTRLTVVNADKRSEIKCRCICGKVVVAMMYDLVYQRVKSCGCYNRDRALENVKALTQHGLSNSYEYRHYYQMVRRCTDVKSPSYQQYGGRGVTVARIWLPPGGFNAFFAHLGPAPSPKHTLDRIDGKKGYKPGNVRWATPKEQAQNKRTNRLVKAFGKTKLFTVWADEYGIARNTLWMRLSRGMSIEDALTEPVKPWRRKWKK